MRKLFASILCLAAVATLAAAGGGAKAGKIEGKWKAVAAVAEGKKVPEAEVAKAMVHITFQDGKYAVSIAGREAEAGTYKTDASKAPATLDLMVSAGADKGKTQHGIYKLEGDTLTVAMAPSTSKGPGVRPKSFEGTSKDEITTFKRVK